MGGYVGRCVVVIYNNGEADDDESCFEAYVWHDGRFPFSDDGDGGSPARLHHCMPSQFIDFGRFVLEKQGARDEAEGLLQELLDAQACDLSSIRERARELLEASP